MAMEKRPFETKESFDATLSEMIASLGNRLLANMFDGGRHVADGEKMADFVAELCLRTCGQPGIAAVGEQYPGCVRIVQFGERGVVSGRFVAETRNSYVTVMSHDAIDVNDTLVFMIERLGANGVDFTSAIASSVA